MKRIEKPWGHEEILLQADGVPAYCTKRIFLKAGYRLSLQYHPFKDEMMLVETGEAYMELGVTVRQNIKPGDTVRVKPSQVHRIKAITDCVLLETSVGDLDSIIRVEDDYGRAVKVK